MEKNKLDMQFVHRLTPTLIQKTFEDLTTRKTDLLDGNIYIAKGADGIDNIKFRDNISVYTDIIYSKGIEGKYLFTPFREVTIPKPPFESDQIEEAKKAGKTRTLSVSTIQDTIFQELMSQILMPFAERKFADMVDMNSFAYRKNKSSKMAVQLVRKYISQGYNYILDGDIEKFFDKIDHNLLLDKCRLFFGAENSLMLKYIYRFINVARIPDGQLKLYRETNGKAGVVKRLLGIPQGGVLSGLLANIFLYDFDKYIVNELAKTYDFKYIRYADDFVLLFKANYNIKEVYQKLKSFLSDEKLNLHPIGKKTKIIDLHKMKDGSLDFLGFSISPNFLRVKQSNVKKFYHRIEEILKETPVESKEQYLNAITSKIRPKIIGLEDLLSENGFCPECNQLLQKRNWIGYFMMIDDVRLLRDMDTRIRKMIYSDFHTKTKLHLKKKELLLTKPNLLSLEKIYYQYKKQEKLVRSGKVSYCNCRRYFDKEKNCIVVVPQK